MRVFVFCDLCIWRVWRFCICDRVRPIGFVPVDSWVYGPWTFVGRSVPVLESLRFFFWQPVKTLGAFSFGSEPALILSSILVSRFLCSTPSDFNARETRCFFSQSGPLRPTESLQFTARGLQAGTLVALRRSVYPCLIGMDFHGVWVSDLPRLRFPPQDKQIRNSTQELKFTS